ncbi:NmrA family NAD(P)-binding protein [Planctomonas psychrotolerans]|uniref:NmrA family NAD(P)-binding protein n=1 Tax=Planctomonas psychrotolerans TaxID=2528712 RepID=UPI0012392A30|nr:NmrA family NAD(P)-binding protein [Planctomonas psychrotolerans]
MTVILLAGATGDFGHRIARELLARNATVRALTRPGTDSHAVERLRAFGVAVVETDYADGNGLREAMRDVDCVVSAVNGLEPVILTAQTQLLDAAVAAGVPRFIPSDYSIDYTTIQDGSNRNLQLRRDFRIRLDAAPIRATSVLIGAFADMLTGVAPIILFGRRRVLYWRSATQGMDFTTKDDAASFIAEAALDVEAPRFLRIAGDTVSARDLTALMTDVSGTRFRATFAGGIRLLRLMARIGRGLSKEKGDAFPAWQGMQYLANMYSGDGKFHALDNDRYGIRRWASARDVLTAR